MKHFSSIQQQKQLYVLKNIVLDSTDTSSYFGILLPGKQAIIFSFLFFLNCRFECVFIGYD